MADFLKAESFDAAKERQIVGTMRHRLAFKTYTETQGSDGSMSRTWTTQAEQWGRVEFTLIGSGEEFEADRVVQRQAIQLIVRYRNDIRPAHLVLYQGLEFEITSVLPDPKNRFLTIRAVQREAQFASFTG